jgi:hypothetical protein
MELALTLLTNIGGGIFASILAILIWERYREPRVAIAITERVPDKEPAIQCLYDQIYRAFYHLTVTNTGKSPAYSCSIRVKFTDLKSKNQLFALSGKWDRGPQPLICTPVPTKVLPDGRILTTQVETRQDFLIPFAETIDVHPGAQETFCIIVKYDGEEECYAFGSWSYIKGNGYKVDDWKLGAGKYMAEIVLTYCGKKRFEKKLTLVNYSTRMDGVEIT